MLLISRSMHPLLEPAAKCNYFLLYHICHHCYDQHYTFKYCTYMHSLPAVREEACS